MGIRRSHRCKQAGRVSQTLTGDVKRCAMVGTGSNKRQAQGLVDALGQAIQLDGDEPLVVVHGNHQIRRLGSPGLQGLHEHGVGRERSFDMDTLRLGSNHGR